MLKRVYSPILTNMTRICRIWEKKKENYSIRVCAYVCYV